MHLVTQVAAPCGSGSSGLGMEPSEAGSECGTDDTTSAPTQCDNICDLEATDATDHPGGSLWRGGGRVTAGGRVLAAP